MGDGEAASPRAGVSTNTGVYLAVLQLVFTLGWTVYAIYLPRLAAQVGIAPTAVILILMLDQAIFTITDTATGIFADKISPIVGRLGVFVAVLTALSCAAFVALPFIAETGPGSQAIFIALIVIWSVTSSALRAPPLRCLANMPQDPNSRSSPRWRCWAMDSPARCRPISASLCAIRTRGCRSLSPT